MKELTRGHEAEGKTGRRDHALEQGTHPASSKFLHHPPGEQTRRELDQAQQEEVHELIAAHVGHVQAEAVIRRNIRYPETYANYSRSLKKKPATAALCTWQKILKKSHNRCHVRCYFSLLYRGYLRLRKPRQEEIGVIPRV